MYIQTHFMQLCFGENLNAAGMRLPPFTGMFTSRYDWARKGQNVRLSGGVSKNNLDEMLGFHSGGVERKEEVRGH